MGSCVCNAAFYGLSCEFSRCVDDCSGHGICFEGKCACSDGYLGDKCNEKQAPAVVAPAKLETLAKPSGLRDALSGFIGKKEAECPEKCNGNGKCGTDGTCDCYLGYTGVACQEFCPNMCSGQGKCTDGRCLCLAGFIGADCSIKSCCSGHGDCTIPGTCICNPGWMGAQCEVGMQCPDPSCSGHGECKDGNCACEAGFTGVTCASPPQECGPCPPGGVCDRDSGVCLCNGMPCQNQPKAGPKKGAGGGPKGGGKGPGGKGGPAGAVGGPGFGMFGGKDDGDAGDDDDDDDAPMTGGGGGPAAMKDGGGGDGPAKKGGDDDAAPSDSGDKVKKINLHPSCNPPYGKWNTTISVCECEARWFGESCEKKHCDDWDPDQDNADCSGHGMCVKGNCFCAAGWGKAKDTIGSNVCKDPVCAVDCGNHGICKDNVCVCQEGWQGPACREPKCQDDCNGHGTCTFTLANSPAECVCEYGWSLPTCATVSLYMTTKKCPNDCSGNGLCMNGQCVCQEGSSGVDCSEVQCPPGTVGPSCQFRACPRDCFGHGVCFNGECTCDKDHTAVDCSIPTKCFEACHAVCLPDLTSSRCEFCKGQCLTLSTNPVVGKHNPMLARLYTFIQGPNHTAPANSTSLVSAQPKHSLAQTPNPNSKQLEAPHRRLRRHHKEVSAVQTGHRAPTHASKSSSQPHRAHHTEVSAVKIGNYLAW